MKRLLACVLCCLLLLSCAAPAVFAADTPTLPGSGTQADPYQIASYDDLLLFRSMAAGSSDCFVLTADITVNDGVFSVDAEGCVLYDGVPVSDENAPGLWECICPDEDSCFSGSLDGQGHTLSGLYGDSLFGFCRSATLKNISLENAMICAAEGCIGGLCAVSENSRILLCSFDGTVLCGGDNGIAGGLVGSSAGDEIALCTNRGSITADTAGGICGSVVPGSSGQYIMDANLGTVSTPAEHADGLGIPSDDDSIFLLCSYSVGTDGGSYHGQGVFDANAGHTGAYTDAASGEEKNGWVNGHHNETVRDVEDSAMKAPDFPALVNDSYAYILDGSFYQFTPGTENSGYPVLRPVSQDELTGGDYHKNFVDGTGDGLFSPTKVMTRAEMAQIFYAITPGLEDGPHRFPDVPDGKWYTTAVNAMAQAGYLSGYTDGTFGPNRQVMRCELVQVLARMSGAEFGGRTLSFTDIADGYWAYDAIAIAQERGWATGVGNNTFLPTKTMTRAEAVTSINAYLGHKLDREGMEAGGFARFFPDVQPNAWYYNSVMEAATAHTVINTNLGERWIGASSYGAGIADGIYLFGSNLYVVQNGSYVTQEGRGTLNGIDYTCTGSSGACLFEGELLTLTNGTVCVLKDGAPWLGRGYFEYEGDWYYGQANGLLLRNGMWNTLKFDAEGKYTSGNDRIDYFIDTVLASVTTMDMTQEQKLRACYNYVANHINYQSNNNHVPHGADPTTWAETYMLRLIDRGRGNCYCYAAEMYYFARRIGYAQARAISGQDSPDGYPVDHGWLEIEINGVKYLFDPEMNHTRNLASGALFKKTYSQTPWKYYPYY